MKKSKFHSIIILSATGAGVGYIPIASGSFASILAAIIVYFLYLFSGPKRLLYYSFYFIITMLLIWIGIKVSDYAENYFDKIDPHEVVIDEIAGYFITMFTIPVNIFTLISAFFIFRFFDITKLGPIDSMQELHGGVGIMMDDVLAGFFSNMIMQLAVISGLFNYNIFSIIFN